MKKPTLNIFLSSILLYVACKTPFTPEVEPKFKNVLVVEGFINIGGETTIKLSRTGDLQDWQTFIPEKNAKVEVEGEDAVVIGANSNGNGTYVLATQSLALNQKYRLKIEVQGKNYYTNFLENKKSPEIDSLNFRVENAGFQVYVSTHDDRNNTRYYSWNFHETWEVISPYTSNYEFINGKVVRRDPDVNITRCWGNALSSHIILTTTERLSEDRVTLAPVTHIKGNSEKLAFRYSILVKQYGLTQQGYKYLENMKKNTEQIGGIFDSQPSELRGNVYCESDPTEQVIGWISAGTETQKRLFISYRDKPLSNEDWVYRNRCEMFNSTSDSLLYYLQGENLIVSEIRFPMPDGSVTITYDMAKEACIDCRLKGTNVKPDYWPN